MVQILTLECSLALRLTVRRFAVALALHHVVLKNRKLPLRLADVDLDHAFVDSVVDLDGDDCRAHDSGVAPPLLLLFGSHRNRGEAVLEQVLVAYGSPGMIFSERASICLPVPSTLVR